MVGGGLVDVPEDVGGDGVEAHGFRHFEAGVPVLAGDAGVVEFAGEDLEGLAVEGEVVAFDGEGVGGCGRCEWLGWLGGLSEDGENGEGEDAGE